MVAPLRDAQIEDASDRDTLREYLDNAILKWRGKRDNSSGSDRLVASCYVDAYQSVRVSMLGSVLE